MMSYHKMILFLALALITFQEIAALAATSVQQDKWFRALQSQLASCKTEEDIQSHFGKPRWRDEREGGVVVCTWDWGIMCIMLGYRSACWGFSAGIDQDTGTLLWWTPQWMGTIPDDAQTVYGYDGEIAETEF